MGADSSRSACCWNRLGSWQWPATGAPDSRVVGSFCLPRGWLASAVRSAEEEEDKGTGQHTQLLSKGDFPCREGTADLVEEGNRQAMMEDSSAEQRLQRRGSDFAHALGFFFFGFPKLKCMMGKKMSRGKKVEWLKWTAGTGRKWILFPLGGIFSPTQEAAEEARTQKWENMEVMYQKGRYQARGTGSREEPVVVVQRFMYACTALQGSRRWTRESRF